MRSALSCPLSKPCAGEFEGRHPAPQRGVCPHKQNPQPTSINCLSLRLVQIVTLTGVVYEYGRIISAMPGK
ncbi:hypothetical protein Cha6605_0681 [Chamaesiphon minutus PCC 6605]|uniref:Uncharacterized protein n=1 Tax=Chamaesiphon minutus (strain ATCC 27169 / PCC 6605) TaxID=1173020 RepID=K9UBF0_CHAP6|nr:hypothetical protein Cha6605_0681 [Chamaesiphon minutus PCC 6605]